MPSLTVLPEDCEGCGVCCMHVGVPPFTEEEMSKLDMKTVADIRYNEDRRDGFPCIWLNMTRRCSRYDERPQTCKDFEKGGVGCLTTLRYGH